MEGDRGFDALDAELTQGTFASSDALIAVNAPYDQFGNHGIIIRRDTVALLDVGFHTNTRTTGNLEARDVARARTEIMLRIFSVDAELHSMTKGHKGCTLNTGDGLT